MLENYELLPNGVIHQKSIKTPKNYDVDYVDERYNTYGVKGMQMAYLRYGYMKGVIKTKINKILDVGYGNGDFLRVCDTIDSRFGNDISKYPLPAGVMFVGDIMKYDYDVITFFDSLEHFEDISFVKDLKTKFVVISVPYCHNTSAEWFENWKHRREDEHLFHFNAISLCEFMFESGYTLMDISSIEDAIRKPEDSKANILTGVFKKR